MTNYEYIPEPLLDAVMTAPRRMTVGVPKSDLARRACPLTPEGAGMLAERGLEVRIQQGAGMAIGYPDARYASHGARIVSRHEALDADIVIAPAPLTPVDAKELRRGALLLSLLDPDNQDPLTIEVLLRRHVTAVALDLVEDRRGMTPFADILAEIEGRAAVVLASALLSDSMAGKGVLLGGVTGIVACEVTIIGSGIAALAAARTASGLGATVRMFDNDVYSLRRALRELGGDVIGSVIHPHVLENALRSADVVIATEVEGRFKFTPAMIALMKHKAVTVDLADPHGRTFPELPVMDMCNPREANKIAVTTPGRLCLTNPGAAVGRTAAMAMSTTLLTMFDRILPCEGMNNALRLIPGLRRAVYTFMGRVVNPVIARCVGARSTDINIYLTLS